MTAEPIFFQGRLAQKVVIVTGAGTGLGEAIAHRFAAEGAKVIVAGMPARAVEDVAAAIASTGRAAISFAGDLSDVATSLACVRVALDTYGRLDGLVANASLMGPSAPVEAYHPEDCERLLSKNCRATFLMARAAIPHLRQTGGNVVITGSSAALTGAGLSADQRREPDLLLPLAHTYDGLINQWWAVAPAEIDREEIS